jgi:hypothetical protein
LWVFLFESAPPGQRGLAGGFAEVGSCGGILLGSMTGSLIANALSTDAIEQ